MDHSYLKLLIQNKEWAKEQVQTDPDYFSRLVNVQKPEFMWIGCSDSRVPPHKVTHTQPGEIFIHRNVANIVSNTDLNLLSCLQYAVQVLKVNHIIVCGHYNCGGVKAAITKESLGLIDNWLRNIKDVYRFNREELENYFDYESRFNRLVELNVIEQVKNLAKNPMIQRSWNERQLPELHGWVYD